ncbi:MAG: DUF2851 family protein [Bacteroidota bacterium]
MREDFLHYLWKQARFNLGNLTTTTGENISIQDFGQYNTDAGPDFSGGQIILNGLHWAGNIEIHVNASEWYAHEHETDPAYDNVILHVVFEEDRPVFRRNGGRIPCLELKGRIPSGLLSSYWRLMHQKSWIACQSRLHQVEVSVRQQWLEALSRERLRMRSKRFAEKLEAVNGDWEEAFYQSMSRALGSRVNADAMEMLARSIPLRVVQKHKHSLLQLEALFFGQSGLIPEAQDRDEDYLNLLRREYLVLRGKHQLRPIPVTVWRFLRLRPNAFPTIRIAQLAAMLHRTGQLFGKSLAAADSRELMNMFEVSLSNYWRRHFRFGKEVANSNRRLGKATIQGILINTITPALAAYGQHRVDERLEVRALQVLRSLPAEQNKVIRQWQQLGVNPASASDSQALLQLKQGYCEKTRCTSCAIGCVILNRRYNQEDDAPLLSLNEAAQVYALAQPPALLTSPTPQSPPPQVAAKRT